jgi:hypothetical protein
MYHQFGKDLDQGDDGYPEIDGFDQEGVGFDAPGSLVDAFIEKVVGDQPGQQEDVKWHIAGSPGPEEREHQPEYDHHGNGFDDSPRKTENIIRILGLEVPFGQFIDQSPVQIDLPDKVNTLDIKLLELHHFLLPVASLSINKYFGVKFRKNPYPFQLVAEDMTGFAGIREPVMIPGKHHRPWIFHFPG